MRQMGTIFDSLSNVASNANAFQQQGQVISQKADDLVGIAEQYAAVQLTLQALATFASLGVLYYYAKTYNEGPGRRTRNNPGRRKRRRS